MTHSSQAGLASLRVGAHISDIPVPANTITIRTDSGVVFELRQRDTAAGPKLWIVMASIGRQSVTAEATVGMGFTVGANPLWWAKGYAQIIQRELNHHFDNIITEVPK